MSSKSNPTGRYLNLDPSFMSGPELMRTLVAGNPVMGLESHPDFAQLAAEAASNDQANPPEDVTRSVHQPQTAASFICTRVGVK